MSKILISLLSEHILPNYLFIKEMEGQYDELLFIGSEYLFSHEIDVNLERTLGVTPESTKKMMVSDENYFVIMRELQKAKFSHDDEYCINQTGGTKALSIAVFQFFHNYQARFVYIPYGSNMYYDFNQKKGKRIKYRVNLEEYFMLHGMTYEANNHYLLDAQASERAFSALRIQEFSMTSDILLAQKKTTAEERRFWLGEWLEEYTYRRIRSEYKSIKRDSIGKSVKIYRKGSVESDNEIDVAFVKDNKLYLIECKVNSSKSALQTNIDKYLYKIAAIMKDLGQNVNSYLFTIQRIDKLPRETRANIKKRAEILGIKGIFDGERLSQKLNL